MIKRISSWTRIFRRMPLRSIFPNPGNLFVILFIPVLCYGQPELPWLKSIGADSIRQTIHTISANADVTVSDGLSYATQTVFHDAQRAIFQQIYDDKTEVKGVEGKYYWSYDGTKEKEVDEFIGEVILGHQFHAQILFFDKLHPIRKEPQSTSFKGEDCLVLSGQEDNSEYKFYYKNAGHPLGLKIFGVAEKPIVYEFDDWQKVSDTELPFSIRIDDGERIFDYTFNRIDFNVGSITDFHAPVARITEEQKLLRCHRVIMDGHLFGETMAMKSQQMDTMVMIGGGEISWDQGRQSEATIDRILASRNYEIYDDLTRPVVTVSGDASLGWVIAQIYAKGERHNENGIPTGPIEFTCSWIELYEKVNGYWKMKGIASTFK